MMFKYLKKLKGKPYHVIITANTYCTLVDGQVPSKCSKCFNSFSPYNSSMRQVLCLSHFIDNQTEEWEGHTASK